MPQIIVLSVEALDSLSRALGCFAAEATEPLSGIESEVAAQLSRLQVRAEEAQSAVSEAESCVDSCRDAVRYADEEEESGCQDDLRAAEDSLSAAQETADGIRRAYEGLERAYDGFRHYANQLSEFAGGDCVKAQNGLSEKADALREAARMTAMPFMAAGDGSPKKTWTDSKRIDKINRGWLGRVTLSRFAAEACDPLRLPPTTLEELGELAALINEKGLPAMLYPETVKGRPITNPSWERPAGFHLPKSGGSWCEPGRAGNGAWQSNHPKVNALTGNNPIQFREGGVDLCPYTILEYPFDDLTGYATDFEKGDKYLAKVLGLSDEKIAEAWRYEKELSWHHHHDQHTLQLVPRELNKIPHTGGASKLRNETESNQNART